MKKLEYDLEYVERVPREWPWIDLKILFRTPWVILRGVGRFEEPANRQDDAWVGGTPPDNALSEILRNVGNSGRSSDNEL